MLSHKRAIFFAESLNLFLHNDELLIAFGFNSADLHHQLVHSKLKTSRVTASHHRHLLLLAEVLALKLTIDQNLKLLIDLLSNGVGVIMN